MIPFQVRLGPERLNTHQRDNDTIVTQLHHTWDYLFGGWLPDGFGGATLHLPQSSGDRGWNEPRGQTHDEL